MISTKEPKEPKEPNKEIIKYLEQLSNIEKKIIKKAEEVLETSFNIERSIGFIEWKKKYI